TALRPPGHVPQRIAQGGRQPATAQRPRQRGGGPARPGARPDPGTTGTSPGPLPFPAAAARRPSRTVARRHRATAGDAGATPAGTTLPLAPGCRPARHAVTTNFPYNRRPTRLPTVP